MSTVQMGSRSTRSATPPVTTARRPTLADVTGKGSGLPNRYCLHAVEGWGKTSFGAYTPKPIFLETRGETGLETLINSGLIPETPHLPECQTWDELLSAIEMLTTETHDFKTLVIDTINGAERLCHEHVCQRDFNNDWTDKGFLGYMRGYEISLSEWRKLLIALDAIRLQKRMSILVLCHTKVKPFKNPEGPDYDRYQPDMHEKTWGLTHKWADAVLFGNFDVTVQADKSTAKKGKAAGGQNRVMYTERHAAYDAKQRLGLPPELEMGETPKASWGKFIDAMRKGQSQGNS